MTSQICIIGHRRHVVVILFSGVALPLFCGECRARIRECPDSIRKIWHAQRRVSYYEHGVGWAVWQVCPIGHVLWSSVLQDFWEKLRICLFGFHQSHFFSFHLDTICVTDRFWRQVICHSVPHPQGCWVPGTQLEQSQSMRINQSFCLGDHPKPTAVLSAFSL